MKLIRLSLRWFRQHRATAVEFPDGLVGIIGPNGAGKSSLVEGLAFALYGARALRGRVEELRTRGAPRDAVTEVTLVFRHEEVAYTVVRSLTEASLVQGGEAVPFTTGLREVSAAIARLLGMTYEEFSATYFTEQKGLEFLSAKKGAAERERFIVRLMGYDKLEKVQELLRVERRDLRSEVQGSEAGLGSRDILEAALQQELAKVTDLRSREAEAHGALKRSEEEVSRRKREFERLDRDRQERERERAAAEELRIRREERERRLLALQSEELACRERASSPDDLCALPERIDKAAQALQAARVVEQQSETIAREQEGRWREKLQQARVEVGAVQAQLQAAERAALQAAQLEAGSGCPTCLQPLGEAFQQVRARMEREREMYMQLLAERSRRCAEVEEEPGDLRQAREDLRRAVEQRQAVEVELSRWHSQRAISEQLTRIGEQQVVLIREIAELTVRTTQCGVDAAASEDAGGAGGVEEEYRKGKAAYDAAQRLLEVLRLQRVRLEGELQTATALLERSRQDLSRYDARAARVNEQRRELLVLEESDRLLTDFRKHLNATLRPRLAELASEFITDLTDGRYSTVEIGDDFTPTVVEDGVPKPVISGGEEDILNLCLRLALSQLLAERSGQSFSLLVLDEVFGSLDDSRRANVLTLLEKLRIRFEQILVITHLDDIKDGVQELIQIEYQESTGEVRLGLRDDDGGLFEQEVGNI